MASTSLARLQQNLNLAGIRLFLSVALGGRASLAVPQLQVPDISCVDWAALRTAGFTGVVFDKDNTLTVPYVNTVHPPLAESLAQCLAVFDGRAVILSNSAGLSQYDAGGAEAAALQAALGVPVLRHGTKKPGGTAEAVCSHFGCSSASTLVMVGDRYLTDVVYGNRHGMLTIRTVPFRPASDKLVVRLARRLEDALLARLVARQVQPLPHALLPPGTQSAVVRGTVSGRQS